MKNRAVLRCWVRIIAVWITRVGVIRRCLSATGNSGVGRPLSGTTRLLRITVHTPDQRSRLVKKKISEICDMLSTFLTPFKIRFRLDRFVTFRKFRLILAFYKKSPTHAA